MANTEQERAAGAHLVGRTAAAGKRAPMYPAERRQEILKLIQQDSRVTVAQLAAHFLVSRASIRRDLNELHNSGLLQRTYGGALGPDTFPVEAPFAERRTAHLDEKDRIGRAAAQLVKAGQTIFLDGGTTTECMAPHLVERPRLTVVTFGLNIANRLAGFEHVTVIVIGGTLHHGSLTLGGVLALESIQSYNMRFDMAFIAASGVSAEGGVTNASFEEIPMKRAAIDAAAAAVLLADSSKVGVVAAGRIVPTGRIHRLITGAAADAVEVERLRGLAVQVDLV